MNHNYYCHDCNKRHDLMSGVGIAHLRKNLTEHDMANFINLSTTLPTYEVVTNGIPGVYEGTDKFVREVSIAQTLQDKFPNVEAYKSSEGLKEWLTDRLNMSNSASANALSRIQGDAAGEVDFISDMQGDIRSLFNKIDFPRNADGRIISNHPGIDAIEINRFTSDIMNEYQIKTLRSADSINDTLKEFLSSDNYKPSTVLVGPQELIDKAIEIGIPNPTRAFGTLQDNLSSAEDLKQKILHEQLALQMTPESVAREVIGGGMIGAAISVTVSSLMTFMQYKAGKLSIDELKQKIAQDGLKGVITGGSLAGLSLFIPGGIIGCGVGFVVGTTLRRLLDEAYGTGLFGDVLGLTKSIHANVELVANGAVYIAKLSELNNRTLARTITLIDDVSADRTNAEDIYRRLEQNNSIESRIDYSKSSNEILSKLDIYRQRLQGR